MTTGIAPSNGIEIAYETHGDANDEPLLLVMGLGAQLITWPIELVDALVDRGFHVIRYDNRDTGLSTKFDDGEGGLDFMAQFMAASQGQAIEAPYLLTDMAADGIGLLDHLGIDSAHIVGASMGGMIVQTMAIEHPARVRTLTSIMSTTGDTDVGQPTPEAMQALLSPPATTRDEAIARSVETTRVISAPVHFDEGRRSEAGGGGLRPVLQPGGRRAPAARHPRLGEPGRGPGEARRPDARGPRQPSIRWSPSPAESARPSSSPAPSSSSSRTWATTSRCRSCRRSSTPSRTSPPAPTPDPRRLTTEGPHVWTPRRPEDHRDRRHRPRPVLAPCCSPTWAPTSSASTGPRT